VLKQKTNSNDHFQCLLVNQNNDMQNLGLMAQGSTRSLLWAYLNLKVVSGWQFVFVPAAHMHRMPFDNLYKYCVELLDQELKSE